MKIDRIHHVAYRCRDAKETVLWYQKMLNMDFVLAIAEDQVPSTKEPDPYMHVFLDAGGGNVLAFFELPTKAPMGRDPNTPDWVQHIAFKVKDRETLLAYRKHLEANGVEVLGVTDHGAFHSIYFFDPNGHRVELACPDPNEAETLRKLDAVEMGHAGGVVENQASAAPRRFPAPARIQVVARRSPDASVAHELRRVRSAHAADSRDGRAVRAAPQAACAMRPDVSAATWRAKRSTSSQLVNCALVANPSDLC